MGAALTPRYTLMAVWEQSSHTENKRPFGFGEVTAKAVLCLDGWLLLYLWHTCPAAFPPACRALPQPETSREFPAF